MSPIATYVVLMLVADVAVVVADVLAKRWTLGLGQVNFFFALLAYALANVMWLKFFWMNGQLGRSSVVWSTTGVIIPVLIGRLVFGEVITIGQWGGVGLCLVGMTAIVLK